MIKITITHYMNEASTEVEKVEKVVYFFGVIVKRKIVVYPKKSDYTGVLIDF